MTPTLALGYGLIKLALSGNASSPTKTCGKIPPSGQLGSGFGGGNSNSPWSIPGVHNCHEHNRECSFIIVIQTSRFIWSLHHHMLAIYCPDTVGEIPPCTKSFFITTPMIYVWYRHIVLLKFIPNSCTCCINYFLYCRHAHTKSGGQGVV